MRELSSPSELPIVWEIGESLLAAADAQERDRAQVLERSYDAIPTLDLGVSRRRTLHRGLLRRGTVIPAIVFAILLLATVALAAGGVIRVGSPAKAPGRAHNPKSGTGTLLPGSVRLLALQTADPGGGPPWGMRVTHTTRSLGCVQVGRLVDGRLGALGLDRAFHDDGAFHEFSPGGSYGPVACAGLDAGGRLFTSVASFDIPASAWTAGSDSGGCDAPRWTHGVPAGGLCPEQDERNLYYGQLGPEARSVTYNVDGHTRVVSTAGPEGAYLIVTPAAGHDNTGDHTGNGIDALVESPITEINYRNGRGCRMPYNASLDQPAESLSERIRISGLRARAAQECSSVGYDTPASPRRTPADFATAIHARLLTGPRGHRYVEISLRTPVPVHNARSAYTVTFHPPRHPGRFGDQFGVRSTDRDIARGEVLRWRFAASRPGVYYGSITYVESRGPDAGGPFLAPSQGSTLHLGNFRMTVR
jgi:hypothetical protein